MAYCYWIGALDAYTLGTYYITEPGLASASILLFCPLASQCCMDSGVKNYSSRKGLPGLSKFEPQLPKFPLLKKNIHDSKDSSNSTNTMGVAKKTRKFAQVKRIISSRDSRLKKNQLKQQTEITKKDKSAEVVREMSPPPSPLSPHNPISNPPIVLKSLRLSSSSSTKLSGRHTRSSSTQISSISVSRKS